MRKLSLILTAFLILYSVGINAQKLTPELVIDGGYYKYEHTNLFPETNGKVFIDSTVNCNITQDLISKNLVTFMSINGATTLSERDSRIIFKVKIDVGRNFVSSIVLAKNRVMSELTFNVIVDYSDSIYQYVISDIQSKERLLKVNAKYVSLAPEDDKTFDMTDAANIHAPYVNIHNINIISMSSPNYVHQQRIMAVIAERNGYVNLVIQECKTVKGLKEKYVQKIKQMDERIKTEIDLYSMEYDTIIKFIDDMNEATTQLKPYSPELL